MSPPRTFSLPTRLEPQPVPIGRRTRQAVPTRGIGRQDIERPDTVSSTATCASRGAAAPLRRS